MTREQALYKFFNQFNIDAYPETSVPTPVKLPYLTYEVVVGDWYDTASSITVRLWYKTESEAVPNEKVREIENKIKKGGCLVPHDNGCIWIKKGAPWCISENAENDNTLKVRVLNMTLEYI